MKDINRRVMLRKRDRLSKDDILKKSKIIQEKLFNSEEYKKAKTVMFFVSFGSEVNTHNMIKESLKTKKVCVPVIEGKNMIAAEIKSFDDLDAKGKLGMPIPSRIEKVEKKDIDLVIVPGIVFDKRNHRIGYGKGFYDNFLRDFKGKKIGIAFKMQVLEIIPIIQWDMQLDKVIDES